jgi:hypothetical protein
MSRRAFLPTHGGGIPAQDCGDETNGLRQGPKEEDMGQGQVWLEGYAGYEGREGGPVQEAES